MHEKIENRHSEAELLSIFKDKKINNKYHQEFVDYYNSCFSELFEDYKDFEDEDFEDEESLKEISLRLTFVYVDKFLQQLEKGHGEDWSRFFANSEVEDDEMRIYDTYCELGKKDKEAARKEIKNLSERLSDDEIFKKYYLNLFEEGDGGCRPRKIAEKYSSVYKKQTDLGKSEIFAHEYANLIAGNCYEEFYCNDFATAYERAILNHEGEAYAIKYADKYASELANIKGREWGSEYEDQIEFAIEKANAYINAWKYVQNNKVDDRKEFMETYEYIHMSTYYSDEFLSDKKSSKDTEREILEKTLLISGKKTIGK